jgi:hypothetical protein
MQGSAAPGGAAAPDEAIRAVSALQLHFEVIAAADGDPGWIGAQALIAPAEGPLAALLSQFGTLGLAPSQKGASASLLLRIGWASGFVIGAYLAAGIVPNVRDYALRFSARGMLNGLWVRSMTLTRLASSDNADDLEPDQCLSRDALRRALLGSLLEFTEPILEALHRWSRFSRHALWSMVTSSWAEQFISIARQLGDHRLGAREAQALFALDARVADAAPELYPVHAGDQDSTCQRRASCCLYYRSPRRDFCASCPIIPADERLERNRGWVARQRPASPAVPA